MEALLKSLALAVPISLMMINYELIRYMRTEAGKQFMDSHRVAMQNMLIIPIFFDVALMSFGLFWYIINRHK